MDKISAVLRKEAPERFLKLYYPFHYKVGFALESVLRGEYLTQHQAVILWIIHSEGEGGTAMRRKDIERRITGWFDVTSSALSKALRAMAAPGTGFVSLVEDPTSGREKRVELTDAGQAEVERMQRRAKDFIERITDDLSDQEIHSGLVFLAEVSRVVRGFGAEADLEEPLTRSG